MKSSLNAGTRSLTGILAGLLVIFTLIWLVQMIGVNMVYGSVNAFEQALEFAREAHWFFYSATYLNALVLTLLNVMLFGSLYGMLKEEHPGWTAIGLAFVPLYAILAVFSYLSQLIVVPVLIEQMNDPQVYIVAATLLRHLIQINSQSTLIMFDQFSYFLLGFPCLIYGLLLWKTGQLRTPGALFTISGALCLIIGPGVVLHIPALIDIPSMAGGVLSILATGSLAVRLMRVGAGSALSEPSVQKSPE